MKIVFYSHIILEVGGGLEKYFIDTSRELTERYPDLEIDIITHDDRFAIALRPLMSLIFMKRMTKADLYRDSTESVQQRLGKRVNYYKVKNFKELRARLSSYDAIYSKNEIIESFLLKFFVGYKHLPFLIFGCHTPIHYASTKSPLSKLHNFLYGGFMYRFLANKVDRFHALNATDAAVLKRQFPSKDIRLIPNPFDFEAFVRKAGQYPYKLDLDPAKRHILWVGRLTEQKGIDDLVAIINSVNTTDAGAKVSWTIAGEGPDKAKIQNLAKRWPNVRYLGHVDTNHIASVYSQHDLFISTSKWEGFPYNLLEAQSFGLPVIAYDIPGCRDIITSESSGQLVTNHEAMAEALGDLAKGDTFNRKTISQQVSSRFNAPRTYEILQQCLNPQKAAK